MDFPYYKGVPKDFNANLIWRVDLLKRAASDPDFAVAAREMSKEDCLFYINAFCWTYNPKDYPTEPVRPFITYEYQDEAIKQVIDAVEKGYDLAWEKSRAMGASWMILTVFEWYWHFYDNLSFLMVSRNENYVDQLGNPKSLFWKIDFIHRYQPKWLLPTNRWMGHDDIDRTMGHLRNSDTGSVIDGESTTGDAGRGDRRTAMLVDEHAAFKPNEGFNVLKASRDTTNCRIFNSTHQGTHTAFYEVVHNTAATVSRLHWSQHPDYRQGLYTSEKIDNVWRLKLMDEFKGEVFTNRKEWKGKKEFVFPGFYPFILDGKLRSPWYDNQCSRCATKQEIAQELDIDPQGSAYQYFDPEFIKALVDEYARDSVMSGNLIFNTESLEVEGFEPSKKGVFHLWFNVDGNGLILTGRQFLNGKIFGVSSDVSMGTGASNSVTTVVDLGTGRKVAVWRDPNTNPEKFADVSIAIAKWFNDAKMIWDASGPTGRVFTQRVLEQKYSNIYYRKTELSTRGRISRNPGYYLNPEDRLSVFTDYRSALSNRTFINTSKSGLNECLQFIVEPGGRIEHMAAINSQDVTGAREAHGDEVIADALACQLLKTKSKEDIEERKEAAVPFMSPAYFLKEADLVLAAVEGGVSW